MAVGWLSLTLLVLWPHAALAQRGHLGAKRRGRGRWRGRESSGNAAEEASTASANVAPPALCTDTCGSARDGKCDDGSRATVETVSVVKCELGTDCTDCGRPTIPQFHPAPLSAVLLSLPVDAPPPPPASKPPVELLRELGIEVFAARTATQPSFVLPCVASLPDSHEEHLPDAPLKTRNQ
jgi:hypothetical protein